jgi:predicted HTH domain antitoxin
MKINIELPDKYFVSKNQPMNQNEIAQQFKLYATLMMYQLGKISAGIACEIMEINRFDFLDYCKEFHISVINYSAEDIQEELEGLI